MIDFRSKRDRNAIKSDAQLGRIFVEAMKIWDAQKSEGVSLTERIGGLRKTLLAAWPQTREWKYLCQQCDDYGLVMGICPGDATCGRPRAHLSHEYGRPCWCEAGRRFKQPAPPSAEDAVSAAAKVRKPTKVGRW